MPDVDIDVSCSECNNTLDVQVVYGQRDVTFEVDPCSHCQSDKYDEGYEAGYESGLEA